MAWNFRKRVKVLPGVHLNLSKGGTSWSVGPRGAKVNLGGKRGPRLTTSIPGTGISHTQRLSGGGRAEPGDLVTQGPTLFGALVRGIAAFVLGVGIAQVALMALWSWAGGNSDKVPAWTVAIPLAAVLAFGGWLTWRVVRSYWRRAE